MKPAMQQGFLLVPLLVFTLLTLLLVTLGSQDLSQSYLHHQLQLYQNCQLLLEQLNSNNLQSCPPCPLASICPHD